MPGRQGFNLKDVQAGAGQFPGAQRVHQVVQNHRGPPADVDEEPGVFHGPKLLGSEHALRLRRFRHGYHHEVGPGQNFQQAVRPVQFGNAGGGSRQAGVNAEHGHAEL